MQVPRQAQVLLQFVRQVACAVTYSPEPQPYGPHPPKFYYKKAEDLSQASGLWLDLFAKARNEAKPGCIMTVKFTDGILSEIMGEETKCFKGEEFKGGLELMTGLANIAGRAACAAAVCSYTFSHKVKSIKGQRATGVLLGPSNPATGALSERRSVEVASFIIDQHQGRLLTFKSLYKL